MKKIYLYIILLACWGCETVVNLPLPPHETKLVVNAYFNTEEQMDVYVSRSYGPLEELTVADVLINDARVELFEDGQLLGELAYTDSIFNPADPDNSILAKYFLADQMPKIGSQYELVIHHDTLETARAETTIPQPINIQSASIDQYVTREIFPDGSGRFQSLLNIEIETDPAVRIYYELEAEIEYIDPNFPGPARIAFIPVIGVARLAENGLYQADERIISPDDIMNANGPVPLLIDLPYSNQEPILIQPLEIQSIIIRSRSISEALAQYRIKLFEQQSGGGFALTPSEPVVVTNNIENGYGIFGATTTAQDTIPQ